MVSRLKFIGIWWKILNLLSVPKLKHSPPIGLVPLFIPAK